MSLPVSGAIMNELGIVVAMSIAAILWAAMSYSVGYREGAREGYRRGRAVSGYSKGQSKIDMDAFWAAAGSRNKEVK